MLPRMDTFQSAKNVIVLFGAACRELVVEDSGERGWRRLGGSDVSEGMFKSETKFSCYWARTQRFLEGVPWKEKNRIQKDVLRQRIQVYWCSDASHHGVGRRDIQRQ